MTVQTAMYDERIKCFNDQLGLLKEKEAAVADQFNALRKQNQTKTDIVNSKVSNKNSNYPFATYEKCFIARTIWFSRLILPTISIRLDCDGVVYGPFRALLDSGAQPNLISYTLFKKLKCIASQASKRILGVASMPLAIKRKAAIIIRPWFESDAYEDEVMWIMPHDNSWRPILPSQELRVSKNDHAFRQTLADPEYFLPKEVHILLGIRFLAKILDKKIGTEPDGTSIFSTPFGNVIMGEHLESLDESENGLTSAVMDESMESKLNGMIERIWKMDGLDMEEVRNETGEKIGKEEKWTKEERMVEEYFMNTHCRDRNGRFIVKIPFKPGTETVGSSRSIAWRRFKCLEKKLQKNREMSDFYINEMRELIKKGHLKQVNRQPAVGKICYYIPHHFVEVKPRVVYDASCLTNTGKSLNSVQMLGPKLQPDLHTTLLRFRRHKVGVCADVQRMFNQVRLHEDQYDCQRIFWREKETDELKEYWMTVVTFGLASSPYLAVRCLIQAAREAQEEFPAAAKVIEQDFYMDDCVSGSDSVAKTVKLAKEVEKVLAGAGFRLRKWKSNKKAVLEEMNKENSEVEEHMVFAEEGQTNILGLKWMFGKDQYTFVVKTPCLTGPLTKRKIVSCVSQLYDPNGFIGASTVIGKLIIQKCWQANIDWDETVNDEIERMWNDFWREIKYLEDFRIDRWIGTSEGLKTKLVGFADSSGSAYGAVVYARTEYPNGSVMCRLITSKSRVAPLKPMTIPRLELAAAELLSRLIVELKESMEFPDMKYILFTDSSPTLYWIRKDPAKLKVYVSNRVKLIQRRTDLKCWHYVNTKHNPADLLSRGVYPSKLVDNKLWLHGPEWLSLQSTEWPMERFPLTMPDHTETEMKVCTIVEMRRELDIGVDGRGYVPVLDYAHNLERAQRILSYVIRGMNAIHAKHRRHNRITRSVETIPHPPTEKEKAWAMEYFIRKAQQQFFKAEYSALKNGKCLPDKSKLEPLKPILDDRGIMRLGGRLDRSHLDYEMKHPPIIPGASRLATLIMEQAHRRCYHGGIQVVTQFIRQRYWIPRVRDELKKFTRTCLVCVRHKPEYYEQLMGVLPSERTVPGKPFLNSGVDYAGPIKFKYVDKDGQTISEHKGWIAVFVCFKTRGVHLELVKDLSSSSFLNCFQKFIGRRGRCTRMFSDNGTSFVGAEKEIARAYATWKKDGTLDKVALEGTDWTFMTPAAPHQGGIYEAAVKSMKFHLRRIIGAKMMEHDQLVTLLTGVEAILNSRPLTPLSDDPGDMQALTPAHFWNMEPLILPPTFRHINDGDAVGRKLWIERNRILEHFWKRWENEYLTTLQERKKWRREKENIKVGQLVILKEENLPPAQWRIGRIQEVMPGADQRVRNVIVKTEGSTYKRPVQKLCVVPIDSIEV